MLNDYTRHWVRNMILMWISQLLVMSGFDAAMPFIPQLLRDNFGMVDEHSRGVCVAIFTFAGALAYAIFCPTGAASPTASASRSCSCAAPS